MITFDGHILKFVNDLCAFSLSISSTPEEQLARILQGSVTDQAAEEALAEIECYLQEAVLLMDVEEAA
jgi:hypothetical protein